MLKNLILLTFLLPIFGFSQIVADGSAVFQSCNCYDITQNTANQVGGFHESTTIDLNNPFHYYFTVNFGCDNTGGEGLAFVMQSGAWALGTSGAGLGYQSLSNSLAIEFDTRDNQAAGENTLGDIGADHISIQSNGSLNHLTSDNLLGVGQLYNINPSSSEVEDCTDHLVEIVWEPGTQTIDVIFDGASSFGGPQNVGDIITNQFGGNSIVTWGWTGSTGVLPASPSQTVCLALDPNISYSATNCPNQSINFTSTVNSYYAITGYSWDFDGLGSSTLPNPSFTFTTAGNHPVSLSVTDINGCTKTETINLGIGFDLNISADDSTICPNSSTVLHANAQPFVSNTCCFDLNLTNLWNAGWYGNYIEVFENGVSVGTYTMGPQSVVGATETHQICLAQDADIDIVINGDQFPGECQYEMVDQNNVVVASVAAGGATWIDGDIQSFTVDCGLVAPSYTYSWDNAGLLDNSTIESPTATIPSTTTFTVQVTDPGTSCTIPYSFTLNTSAAASATLSGNVTVCQGSTDNLSINFTGTPPYEVVVNIPGGGQQTYSGITANPYSFPAGVNGTFTLASMTGDGCTGTVSGSGDVTVIIPPSVDIDASQSVCDGDPIAALTVISANGGTVNWYSDAGLTTLLSTGNSYTPPSLVGTNIYYAQEVESVLGCAGPADNVTITVNQIPPAPNVTGTTTYCENDTPTPLTSEMSLGGSPTWYNNSALTPPDISTLLQYNPTLTVGTLCYYVTETANGCTGPSTEICVTTNPQPSAPTFGGITVYCEGETPTALTVTPDLGGSIDWFNSSGTLANNTTSYTPDISNGDVSISATETLNGCVSEIATVDVTVNVLPIVILPDTLEMCKYDSLFVTAQNNGFDMLWSNGSTDSTSYIQLDSTGYIYVVSNNPLCGSTADSTYLIVHNLPSANAGNDTVIGIGGEVNLWAYGEGFGEVSYEWTPTAEDCITENCSQIYVVPNQATLYIVDITDEHQCHNYDTVLVDVSGYQEVFIPNIFSPNGDGYNDYLEIKGPRLFKYEIKIYDRWGKIVFESTEQKEYWDGTFKGNALAEQTFVYTLVGETVLGEKINLSGNVTIVK